VRGKSCLKSKRTNFRWPFGLEIVNRPDPDDPGGLGAEESGTEGTGPTHTAVVPGDGGARWAEVGLHYDSANDPVTLRGKICRVWCICRGGELRAALLRRPSDGAIMSH